MWRTLEGGRKNCKKIGLPYGRSLNTFDNFALFIGLEHWEEVKKTQKVYIQMWHVLQSEVSDKNDSNKNDSNKLSVDPRSRSRSNSGALCIPKDFDPKKRRNSSLAVIDRRWFDRRWFDRKNWSKKLIKIIFPEIISKPCIYDVIYIDGLLHTHTHTHTHSPHPKKIVKANNYFALLEIFGQNFQHFFQFLSFLHIFTYFLKS